MTDLNLEDLGVPTGIDVDSLKKTFEKENQKFEGGQADSRFVYLPKGKTTVRILPPYSKDKKEYFEAFLQHRIGGRNITCPRERKFAPLKECPICQLASKLYNAEADADREVGKQIYARKRFYYNVILRKYTDIDEKELESKGLSTTIDPKEVKILSTGIKLYDKIKQIIFETSYGDITHVLKGYDFVIVKKIAGDKFPNYDNSYAEKDSTYLAKTADDIREIMGNVNNLSNIVGEARKSSSDMLKILEEHFETTGNTHLLSLLSSAGKTFSVSKPQTQNYFNKNDSKTEDDDKPIDISEVKGSSEKTTTDPAFENESIDDWEKEMQEEMNLSEE